MPRPLGGIDDARANPWDDEFPPSKDVLSRTPPGPFVTGVVASTMSMLELSEKSRTIVPGLPGRTEAAPVTVRSWKTKMPPLSIQEKILARLAVKVAPYQTLLGF